jgi:hypothetical protein
MNTRHALKALLLLLLSIGGSSCATVLDGTTARVTYEGGNGPLVFYDQIGNQIPSEYEFYDLIHYNYIELSKKHHQHVITARQGNRMQRDTLRREFGYGWLIPNALLIYTFPVFTAVDLITSAIYSFPSQRVHLSEVDSTLHPIEEIKAVIPITEVKPDNRNVQVSLHTGLLSPAHAVSDVPAVFGIHGGYKFYDGLWATLGYTYGMNLEQKLGTTARSYSALVHTTEAAVEYFPVKFAYLTAGFAYDHLVFERTFNFDEEETARFGRNLIAGNLGGGLYFSGLFLEMRRHFALKRIETPEGPGQDVAFTSVRFGLSIRFEAPR